MRKDFTRRFQPGLKYVFTKKKFVGQVDDMGDITKMWVNRLNGRQVYVLSDYEGCIGDYRVLPEWCKCIGGYHDEFK